MERRILISHEFDMSLQQRFGCPLLFYEVSVGYASPKLLSSHIALNPTSLQLQHVIDAVLGNCEINHTPATMFLWLVSMTYDF